jgi:hypothetical protein
MMFQNQFRSAAKKWVTLSCSLSLLLSFPGFVVSERAVSVQELTTVQGEKEEVQNHVQNQWEVTFQEQVKHWIHQISEQEALFKAWKNQEWESYPFGPGSKQWIVLILDQGKEIGYLMIGQTENGELQLIEYGKSDQSVLSKVIAEDKLVEDFVYGGLLWAEKEKNVLVDLLTYEAYEHVSLESFTPSWLGEQVQLLDGRQIFSHKKEREPIVYYTSSPSEPVSLRETRQLETSKSYFYQAEILPQVTALYNVIGLHLWDSDTETSSSFVGIQDEGVRFLSYRYLDQMGSFSVMP